MNLNDLKMDDLFVVCDKCNGKKNITEVSTRGSFGGGRVTSYGPCNKCNGMGGKLTEAGKILKAFIQKVDSHQV